MLPKKLIILSVISVVFLYFFSWRLQDYILASVFNVKKADVFIRGEKVLAELARTSSEQARGLSGRSVLGEDQGMLFVFKQKQVPAFWMKNMEFPIDIIWIRDRKVVDLVTNVLPPPKGLPESDLAIYLPKEPVNYVLEVPAGFVEINGIKVGDKVDLR